MAIGFAPTGHNADQRDVMLAEVRMGLSLPQKELPPTYFYDDRGSLLFEQITQLPEYYLTRVERELLEQHARRIIDVARPASIAELGPGSASKSRILIEAALRIQPRVVYVPLEISAPMLARMSAALEREYDGLTVQPVVTDVRHSVQLPAALPRPLLYAFLGSTIGNFTASQAAELLSRMATEMRQGDRLLLGVDLVKEISVLESAYNDARGLTAEFNSNVLRVLNRELSADFDLSAFAHRAFYEPARRRIEMHLVARRAQRVLIPGAGTFSFAEGDSIRTEISCKYDRAAVEGLLLQAGLALDDWIADRRGWFALALAVRHA